MFVFESLASSRPIEGTQSLQSPERMHASEIGLAFQGELLEWWHRFGEAPVDEKALGGVSPPAVGMAQSLNELGGTSFGQDGGLVGDGPIGCDDSPDPAEVNAGLEIARLHLVGDPRHEEDDVFDDALVHVGDVKGAVRAGAGIDGSEPFVCGSEKFLSGRIVALGLWGKSICYDEASDEMATRFGHKQVLSCVVGKLITTVDTDAGGYRVGAQCSIVAQLQTSESDLRRRADRKHFLSLAGDYGAHSQPTRPSVPVCKVAETRMAACVFLRHVVHHGGRAFSAGVESSEVVETHSELPAVNRVFLDEFALA